ncbi:MAG TPA: hypothetical protein DEP53_09410 [Bacteroidetes bacterium]|nr:hypothetical protein [Bacteroidota bacterium]
MKLMRQYSAFLLIALFLVNLPAGAQTSGKRSNGCLGCHTTEIPTKANPSLKKCPRAGMVTVHALAVTGPDKIVLQKITGGPDLYEPVLFTHKVHAKMSEMSGNCVLCHHYNPPGSVLACSECHVAETSSKSADLSKPGLKGAYHRQCINCHRESGLSATKCESCHALKADPSAPSRPTQRRSAEVNSTRPMRLVFDTSFEDGKVVTFYHNDHTERFGLSCTACHVNERCAGCHKPAGALAVQVARSVGGHERCSSCHSVDTNCSRCHDKEPRAGFNHARRARFDLARFHSTLACTQCHKGRNEYKGLSGNCGTCHAQWKSGSFNHSVTGLKLDETHGELDCDSCHEGRDFARKPTCSSCHEDKSFPDKSPGTKVRSVGTKSL